MHQHIPLPEQQNTQQTTQTPVPPKKSRLLNRVLVIASILLVLFVGFWMFRLVQWFPSSVLPESIPYTLISPTRSISPTPDPTTSWQTYRNEEYGFEFEYPNEYQLDSSYFTLLHESPVPNRSNYYCEPSFFDSLHVYQKKYKDQIEFPAVYLHFIDTKKEITSIIDDCVTGAEGIWKRNNIYSNSEFLDVPEDFPGPSVLSREIVSYDSVTVNKVKHLLSPTNILIMNYYYRNNGLFVLIADSEEEQITDQILATFRFLEEEASECVVNGVTYQDGERYPAGDGCNTCICNGGCTKIGCANPSGQL